MRIRSANALTAAIVVAMLALSAWAWSRVADGASLPVHWDLGGNPNGYASKPFALLGLPALALVLIGIMAALPRIDPRGRNLQLSRKAYTAVFVGAIGLMGATHVLLVYADLTDGRLQAGYLLAVVGVFMAVVGNYLGKLRSNFFVGIRTPWTLSSELSWNRTHRVAGRLMMGAGLACSVLAVAGVVPAAFTALLLWVGSLPFVIAYSYVVWRNDPARGVSAGAGRRTTIVVGVVAVIIVAAIGVTLVVSLAGGRVLGGAERAAVLAYSEPETDNLTAGLTTADYVVAARDFDPVMRGGLDAAGFLAARAQIRSEFGDYRSRVVERVEQRGDLVTVYYLAHFDKQDATMKVSFHLKGEHQVSGWYVRKR